MIVDITGDLRRTPRHTAQRSAGKISFETRERRRRLMKAPMPRERRRRSRLRSVAMSVQGPVNSKMLRVKYFFGAPRCPRRTRSSRARTRRAPSSNVPPIFHTRRQRSVGLTVFHTRGQRSATAPSSTRNATSLAPNSARAEFERVGDFPQAGSEVGRVEELSTSGVRGRSSRTVFDRRGQRSARDRLEMRLNVDTY